MYTWLAVAICLVVAVVVTVFSLLLFRFVQWYFSPLRQLPGPKNRGNILGNFVEIRKEPTAEPHKRWLNEIGWDVPVIHYTVGFWRPSVLIMDKNMIRDILTAPYGKACPRFSKDTRFLSDVLGDGLVTLLGMDWMRHRRMLQPSFNTNFLRESLNESIPPKVNRFVEFWTRASGTQREIDVNSHLSALTLDVIGDVAFSHDFHALESVEEWSKYDIDTGTNDDNNNKYDKHDGDKLASINDPFVVYLTKSLRVNLITLLCSVTGLMWFNRYINPELRENRRKLDQAVDRVVSNARTDTVKTKSLLHLMLQAKDPEDINNDNNKKTLSDAELRDEVKTFIIAGHETTSTWLYWALFALAEHPDIQAKVFEDVVKYASHQNGSSSSITLVHVEQMEYFNAFLQEVLRFYSPVAIFTRNNTQTEDLGQGVVLPPNTRITISPHLMHRNPKYWDDPDIFWPERWLNVSEQEMERRRFAFLPFSLGGRNCVGQKFATMEAQLILAPLVRAFRVMIAPSQRDTDFVFATNITMKSKPLLKLCIKKR